MPNKRNLQLVADLKERLKDTTAVYFTNYHGLTVSQLQELRSKLRESGSSSKFMVVKNKLLIFALRQLGYQQEEEGAITGPTAILICQDDELKPLSVLAQFRKNQKNLTFKGGYLNKEWLVADQVQTLASLPPIETLRAQATYAIASPLNKLQVALSWHLQGLVQVLNQIQKGKQPSKMQGGDH